VKYALLGDPAKIDPALAGKKVSTIIWTTTPWTLPASMAVAFHPNEEYVALESGGEVYIVASKLAKDVAEKCGLADPRELAHFPGRKLERLNFSIRFSIARFWACSPTTSPWTRVPVWSTPRLRTARKTLPRA
jgi:isoleucyl-tRNA synthetase